MSPVRWCVLVILATVLHLQLLFIDWSIDPDADGRGRSGGSLGGGKKQQCQLKVFFKRVNYFFILRCEGAFGKTVVLLLWKGNFVEVVPRDTEREGWVSSSDVTAGAGLSSSHWNRASLQPDVPVFTCRLTAAAPAPPQHKGLQRAKHLHKVRDKLWLSNLILYDFLTGKKSGNMESLYVIIRWK